MLKEERFNHILKVIKKKGKVFYETLSEDLDISEDTVRRDIESLHNNGLLCKVRGGAISISNNPLSFQDRTHYLAKEKELIALKSQQLIKKGQTIFCGWRLYHLFHRHASSCQRQFQEGYE